MTWLYPGVACRLIDNPRPAMCYNFSSTPTLPQDNSAQLAQSQQDARAANITTGRSNIDQAFAPFDQSYYDNIGKAYSNNYLPQVKDQYNTAYKTLIANLSNSGNLQSSTAADQEARLAKTLADEQSSIGNQAIDAENAQRTAVTNAKNNLYGANIAAADPSSAAATAASQVSALHAPASYSPLGDTFAGVLNSTANQVQATRALYAVPFATPGAGGPFGTMGGYGPAASGLGGGGSSYNVVR